MVKFYVLFKLVLITESVGPAALVKSFDLVTLWASALLEVTSCDCRTDIFLGVNALLLCA